MPRARKVVADQSSAEYSELQRQFNNLLIILEQVCSEAGTAATLTPTLAFQALADALNTGTDVANAPHVGTNRELNGVRGTPTHPRRARNQSTILMDSTTDF